MATGNDSGTTRKGSTGASRKAATTASRKSTPAGRKSRTSPTRRSTAKTASAPTAKASSTAKSASPAKSSVASQAAKAQPVAAAGSAPASANAASNEKAKFKRPDLIDAVAERTAMKRSDAKLVLELVLDELGRALDGNEELVLPPLGKLMVKRRKDVDDGPDVLTVKIKRPDAEQGERRETTLAAADKYS